MLGLGLGLSIKDFTRILRTPKDFFVGFFSQLIILPIVALGVALVLNLSAPLAVGLMFNDIAYVIPTAAYALKMYVTGFIFIYILKKSN